MACKEKSKSAVKCEIVKKRVKDLYHELQFCTFDLFDMIPVTNNKEKQPWAHRNRDLLTTHSIIEPLNRTLKLSEY